jgi:predicted RNA-binding Zn-ribbon protein involved in translation (DUF1610 family)
MPFLKLKEDTPEGKASCMDREHNPPTGICPEPGIYEWSCPSCGAKKIVRIPRITS